MILWPFPPAEEMIESLEWSTDVIRAKAGEQRLALREAPRQSFAMTHYLRPQQYARARAMVYRHEQFIVPVWPERTFVGAISAGAASLALDTSAADYRARAVIWQSDELCEVVDLSAVGGSSLTVSAVANDYTAAFVMPARLADAPQGFQGSRTDPNETQATIEFRAVDNADLGGNTYPVFGGFPVQTIPSQVTGSLSEAVLADVEIADNEAGIPIETPRYDRPTRQFSSAWAVHTLADLWELRQFLHYLRGKQKTFWLPSWGYDFVLVEPIGSADTTISVLSTGFVTAYDAAHLMIRTKSGAVFYRAVTDATTSGPDEVLTISSALGSSLAIDDIDRISMMYLVRLDADRVELRHRAGYGADVAVPVVETYDTL